MRLASRFSARARALKRVGGHPLSMSRSGSSSIDGAVPRLDSLTGARFVAALAVFLFHAGGIFPAEGVFGKALAFISRDGGIGVDFFFVLSGFVLAWSWRPGSSVKAFYRRRFARLEIARRGGSAVGSRRGNARAGTRPVAAGV